MVVESRPRLATNIFYYLFGAIAQHELLVFVSPVMSFYIRN